MDKATIRTYTLQRLRDLDASSRSIASQRVCQNALDAIDWSTYRRVYCYRSQPQLHEIDTTWLIKQLRSRHHLTVDIAPHTSGATLPSAAYDLIIVPLVAFTADCHRLGRGGGWYDRLLAEQPHAQTIGLAYDLQCAPQLPVEPHDITLGTIITEVRTYTS